jgi:phosphoserine phosphatase
MENKQALTLVGLEFLNLEEIEKYLSHNFSVSINSKKSLSARCLDFEINCLNEKKEKAIRKYFNSKKIDICIQDLNFRDKKLFISDMDTTIIENETLDDLVKIAGINANVDENTKLSMEGKIDIRTTLDVRVNYLKNKSKELINEVIKKIKFNPGSDILIKTLNKKNYLTILITAGFAPVSTYVSERLGFKKVLSNEFEFDNNKFTGKYVPIIATKNAKLNYLKEICTKKTTNQKKVVTLGDGANDLGMLNYSGLGIGYNAHQIVKDNIKNQIFYTDLKSVLFFLGINEIEFTK